MIAVGVGGGVGVGVGVGVGDGGGGVSTPPGTGAGDDELEHAASVSAVRTAKSDGGVRHLRLLCSDMHDLQGAAETQRDRVCASSLTGRAARPTAKRTKTDRDYFGVANRYPCMSHLRLAPEAVTTHEPVVRVYAARCRSLLGLLGVHTWIATKRRGANAFTVYEVMGGRLRVRAPVLRIRRRVPGLPWFGHSAERLCEKRGDAADALIARIEQAVSGYW